MKNRPHPSAPRAVLQLGVAALLLSLLSTPALAHDVEDEPAEQPISRFFNPQFCPNTLSRQKIVPRMASNCKGIVIPWGLCRKCHMRKHDKNGNFKNNRDMYDLALPGCQYVLKRYVQLNPCDWPRARDIKGYANVLKGKVKGKWKAAKFQKDLGEFMYNVCELCCDCVPIGLSRKRSLAQEYEFRKKKDNGKTGQNGLIQIYRGNCPVHYYYDTCRMWPELRDVASQKKFLNTKKDRICWDHVYPWWKVKKYRNNWLRLKKATIPSKRFVNFLVKINQLLGCRNKRLWIDCARLEMAQKRV